jgi:dipeptidyl-peptidase 4
MAQLTENKPPQRALIATLLHLCPSECFPLITPFLIDSGSRLEIDLSPCRLNENVISNRRWIAILANRKFADQEPADPSRAGWLPESIRAKWGAYGFSHSRVKARIAMNSVGAASRRFFLPCLIAAMFSLAATVASAQVSADSDKLLHRVFGSRDFQAKQFGPARWLKGGEFYTTVEPSSEFPGARDIVRYETATGKREVLVAASKLIPAGAKWLDIDDYAWSQDSASLLVFTNSAQVWRQKTRGDYWVLNLKTGALHKVGGDAPPSTMLFAKFSPDGSKVAYVRANNLYVEELASGRILPLTSDGSESIINGTSDWVYEEELALRDCFRWSPDGKSIAYWQFNTQGVKIFPLEYNLGEQRKIVTGFPYPGLGAYPSILNIPYPIPGTTNSAVRVGVVSAEGGETRWMDVPGDPRDNYIARMDWAGNSRELYLEHLNRLQNTNDLLLADASSGSVHSIFQDRDDAWVNIMDDVTWVDGGAKFLWLSERDGWRHAYLGSRDGSPAQLITTGAYDVISLSRVDEKGRWLYFIASPENAMQRYLYRVRLDGSGKAERVSPSNASGMHFYDVSPDANWAFHTYSRADQTPVTDLVELPVHLSARILEDNPALRANAAAAFTSKMEFFRVDVGDGVTLDGCMLKPPNFDPTKKYPVLVYVYGEPAAQTVLDGWSPAFYFNRVAAAAGYLIVSFDNRGTPGPKGRAWRKSIYGSIHPVVVKDQSAALKEVLRTLPYADPSRVAVWGKSGGGSSTLNLMFRAPDLYKVGMAVAPVPELRLYDTIYQERYMGLPLQNVEGYRNSSAINFAEGLRGSLLIVHGSGDDNVHYAGTELLLNRLIELDKPVDFMEYPNRTHAISEGAGTVLHVNSLLLRYLEEHLPPEAK